MHILIVEDDERIVSFMKRGLEAEEHDVDIASHKCQTLSLVDAGTYDVIILDIFLGADDGLDICRTLRQRGVKAAILLMTAKGTTEIETASKQAGADAYLAKPFSFDDLVATIARFGKSCTPADSRMEMSAEDNTSSQNNLCRVFTKSDHFRPTNMTRAEMDRRGCFIIDMGRMWRRL